ncbi:MAG: F0F1 ATP synthase subunit B [Myxococcales bacterium]|nr:F0F1 ATP synthase subunit B [Myxococcales bacterium]
MSFLVLASSLTSLRPGLIFWTLVTFILVALVLRAKAWKPILQLVEEREKQIAASIESAKRERAEAEKLLADQKAAAAEARREAAEMMRKNKEEVDRFREELIAKSRKEVEELKAQARRDIEDERKKAVAELRSEAVGLALQIAERLLDERMDEAKHRQLAEKFVAELPKANGGLRQALGG